MATVAEEREMVGRMVEHAINNGTKQQIDRVADALFIHAKDYIPNGAGFTESDRQDAMATLRDLAFEAATGLDATADAHAMTNHWLPRKESNGE